MRIIAYFSVFVIHEIQRWNCTSTSKHSPIYTWRFRL